MTSAAKNRTGRSTPSLLIKGGHLIDPAARVDAPMDLLLKDGRVAEVALPNKIKGSADEKVDARGLIVAPGFIDLHVHLREPGQAHKETIATGTAAADGKPILEDSIMREALVRGGELNFPVVQHAEDTRMTENCPMHAGSRSSRLGLRGMTAAAEASIVERDIQLAMQIPNARLHVAHLSTADALKRVRRR